MIKCSECGYENMDGLDYCDGCGAKLAAAAGSSAAAAPAAVEVKPDGAGVIENNPDNPPSAGTAPTPVSSTPGAEAPSAEMPKSEAPTGEIKPEAPPPESAPATAAAAGAPFKAKLSVVRGGRK